MTRRRRLSTRSATRPPQAPKRSMGRNCRARVIPMSTPRSVAGREVVDDEPGQGDALHPGAAHRDDLPGEVQPVVAGVQRLECRVGDSLQAGHGCSTRCSSSRTTSSSAARSSAGSRAQPTHQVGGAQRAAALQGASALGGELHPHDAAVGVVLVACHEPGGLEPHHDLGHAGRLHLLRGRPARPGWGCRGVRRWRAPRPATRSPRRRPAGAAGATGAGSPTAAGPPSRRPIPEGRASPASGPLARVRSRLARVEARERPRRRGALAIVVIVHHSN